MSNKEIDDLKTLIKSLNIRLKNDEISQEEYETLKMKYESQLEEELSLVKEKSFLKDLSYISISGSGKVTDSYISISGSGRVEGWKGGTISVSGSGKISDDEIRVSGSAKLPGDLQTKSLISSGSLKAEGSIESDVFTSSGSCKVQGAVIAHEKMAVSGAGKFESDVDAGIVNVSGAIKVNGDLKCITGEIDGAFKIVGNVICEESFEAEMSDKCDIIGNLECGGNIRIEQSKRKGRLTVPQIIAGGEVYLEGVKADYVKGRKVVLGDDCHIKEVEESS